MQKSQLIIAIILTLVVGQLKSSATDALTEGMQKLTISQHTTPLQDNIKASLASLSDSRPFAYFNLQLSEDEINTFDSLNFNVTNEYESYGIDNNFTNELMAFIRELGHYYEQDGKIYEYKTSLNESIVHNTAQTIVRLIQDTLKSSQQETALVKIRAALPTTKFDVPRWHIDKSETNATHRFVIALKGPGTLFYDLPAEGRREFFATQEDRSRSIPQIRELYAKSLDNTKLRSQPPSNQGAVFMVNSCEGAVHSEPPINQKRLFLAISPTNKSAIISYFKRVLAQGLELPGSPAKINMEYSLE